MLFCTFKSSAGVGVLSLHFLELGYLPVYCLIMLLIGAPMNENVPMRGISRSLPRCLGFWIYGLLWNLQTNQIQ